MVLYFYICGVDVDHMVYVIIEFCCLSNVGQVEIHPKRKIFFHQTNSSWSLKMVSGKLDISINNLKIESLQWCTSVQSHDTANDDSSIYLF